MSPPLPPKPNPGFWIPRATECKRMENMSEKLPGIPELRLRHFATYSPWDYRDVQIRMA